MAGYMLSGATADTAPGSAVWDADAVGKADNFCLRLNQKRPQFAGPEHLFHYTNVMLDPEEGGRFGIGSNGTGPFTLAEFRVGERALLRAHEGAGRRAKLDELLLLDLGDEAAACARSEAHTSELPSLMPRS